MLMIKKVAFKRRLLCDDKVYLKLSDCAQILGTDEGSLLEKCSEVCVFEDLGRWISEGEFNRIYTEYFSESDALLQLTVFDTLDAKAANILRFYPLKELFVGDIFATECSRLGMSADEYIENVDFPNEVEIEKARMLEKEPMFSKLSEYVSGVNDAVEKCHSAFFEKFGLTLQHMMVLEKGCLHFNMYLAGDGIFYTIDPETFGGLDWDTAEVRNSAIVVMDTVNGDEIVLPLGKVNRDFRNHGVFENLLYCLCLLPGSDEWQDSISISVDGVSVEISKIFMSKILNPGSFSDVCYMCLNITSQYVGA